MEFVNIWVSYKLGNKKNDKNEAMLFFTSVSVKNSNHISSDKN